MMIDIEFKIGGKKVRPNQIGDALERAVFEQVQKDITQKLRGIKDPETGASPKITVKGHSFDDLSFEVNGSEALIAEVKNRLS